MTDCRNHEGVQATHTANMTLAVPPYRQDVPLCGECAPRIQRIGFDVTLTPIPTFTAADYEWNGVPMSGLCGHCGIHVDSRDPNHRVTSIVNGGRGVECVLRGDITPEEGGPLRAGR